MLQQQHAPAHDGVSDIRPEFMEHVRRDVIAGAVGAIDDDTQPAQIQ